MAGILLAGNLEYVEMFPGYLGCGETVVMLAEIWEHVTGLRA